jgi:hypothetical protein
MFGYLNLNDPTKIANNEAQEALNCRVDRGYLEYKEWSVDTDIGRELKDLSGRRLFIDATFPAAGGIFREVSVANPKDPIGLPDPSTLTGWNPGTNSAVNTPYIQAVVSAGQFYPVGSYDYAITIYDADTGEESVPYQFAALPIGASEKAEFGSFPAVGDTAFWATKPNLQYRIYRRPLGGSEFLRTTAGSLSASTGDAGPSADETIDAALGVACDSWDNYPIYTSAGGTVATFRFAAIHKNKLFLPTEYSLFYSKTAELGAFPLAYYYSFPSAVLAAVTLGEALFILTQKHAYVLYGQDENDFLLKRIDDGTPGAPSYDGVCPLAGRLAFLGGETTAKGVYLAAGAQAVKASNAIESYFPVMIGGSAGTIGAGAEENRFAVFDHRSDEGDPRKIILDTATGGFLLGDDSGVFSYRSKEFGRPGAWDNMRRAFVRGVGDFTIELYGDLEKIDEINFSISGSIPQTEDFTVPPTRHNHFSFRIIGQQNAKVYEFGRLE